MIQFPARTQEYHRENLLTSIHTWRVQWITTDSAAWQMPVHMLGQNMILYADRGSLRISVNGKARTLSEGDILCVTEGALFGMRAEKASICSFCLVEFVCNAFAPYPVPDGFCLVSMPRTIHEDFYRLYRAARPTDRYLPTCDAQLLLILEDIRTSLESAPGHRTLYETLCRYIFTHAKENPTVGQIADALNYSRDHLCRVAQKCGGKSVQEMIAAERIRLSKGLLLSTDYSVEKIASMLHFFSANSFLKYFQYHTHMTPAAYRRTKKGSV